ncbi:molybdate ABC transporter substrate-binding protein [Ornithinibacillus salinisoli]|uniref:Molybdate ABC transporter substrate-binding protein n=1 Tax=Ornithinibacillus salinisoli TaxID=1848459 RepID=A0ABW4W2J3_9BACI
MKHFILLLSLVVLMTACSTNESNQEAADETTLLISAATSLTDALNEIVDIYEAEHKDTRITINIGGSGTLARQIQQGAPADVFLSADEKSLDLLEKHHLLLLDTKVTFAKNKLILIGNSDSKLDFATLEDLIHQDINQIAIGNPESVPAGNYAKDALQSRNLWNNSSLQEKLVFAKDVRQVLTYVASGNTEVGFVYYSDILQENNVQKLLAIEEHLHEPIIYPGAVTTTSEHPEVAKQFLLYLQQDQAREIFKKHGFTY